MALSPEEKHARKRARMLKTVKKKGRQSYKAMVASEFQAMIRAEAGSQPAGETPAVVDGELTQVFRDIGQVVCVTCGKVRPWRGGLGGGPMDTGHFVEGRSNSILFEDTNVAPQCVHCNRFLHGNQRAFRMWMEHVHGESEVERLQQLKHEVRKFTDDELVDMKIEFTRRLNAAIERMEGHA